MAGTKGASGLVAGPGRVTGRIGATLSYSAASTGLTSSTCRGLMAGTSTTFALTAAAGTVSLAALTAGHGPCRAAAVAALGTCSRASTTQRTTKRLSNLRGRKEKFDRTKACSDLVALQEIRLAKS